jgi:hypothetical protein
VKRSLVPDIGHYDHKPSRVTLLLAPGDRSTIVRDTKSLPLRSLREPNSVLTSFLFNISHTTIQYSARKSLLLRAEEFIGMNWKDIFASRDDKHETGDCLPDACGNEEREGKLMERQRKDDGRRFMERAIARDRNLIIACAILVVLMNISTGRYILYPFTIFSTWVHEMCHGVAALLMGGSIGKLQIFKDGSGLAFTSVSGNFQCGFVSSGGYPGTAFTGCLLLLFRRTTLGPTIGTIGMGLALLLSCALYVRNTFGLIMLSGEGVFLLLAAWLLPAHWLDNLYNFLAVTICLNAFTSIRNLFSTSQGYVNGQAMSSDAHSVAEFWGADYRFWAMLWLIMSFVATFIGIMFARDAREWINPSNGGSLPTTTHGGLVNNGYATAVPVATSVSPVNASTPATANAVPWTNVPYVAYTT